MHASLPLLSACIVEEKGRAKARPFACALSLQLSIGTGLNSLFAKGAESVLCPLCDIRSIIPAVHSCNGAGAGLAPPPRISPASASEQKMH